VLGELFFIIYQLVWAVHFASSGLYWSALAATLVAGCVLYLAFFYGDHAGKVCFVLDQDRLLASVQDLWRSTLERRQFYTRLLGAVAFLLVLLSLGGQFARFDAWGSFSLWACASVLHRYRAERPNHFLGLPDSYRCVFCWRLLPS
jgi:hypothetical protein